MPAEASQPAHHLLIFCFAAMLLLWNTANAATFLPQNTAKGKRQHGARGFRPTATALPRREGARRRDCPEDAAATMGLRRRTRGRSPSGADPGLVSLMESSADGPAKSAKENFKPQPRLACARTGG